MALRKQPYRRRTPAAKPAAAPADDSQFKTSGVTEADVIRIRSKIGSGIFRDGMTVGEFLRSVPSRDGGLRMLASCRRARVIGFEQASLAGELAAAQAAREEEEARAARAAREDAARAAREARAAEEEAP